MLDEEGVEVSLMAAKATIQLARYVVQEPVERETEALTRVVSERLQARSVVLPVAVVKDILEMYAKVIFALDVLEINEIG